MFGTPKGMQAVNENPRSAYRKSDTCGGLSRNRTCRIGSVHGRRKGVVAWAPSPAASVGVPEE